MKIGFVINYCSIEKQFLNPLLKQCTKITDNIAVSYGSHLFDGTPEPDNNLDYYKYMYPFIEFVKYDVNLTQKNLKGVVNRPTAYWCNLARWVGYQALQNRGLEWIFFIDADEIPDGERLKDWLNTFTFDPKYIMKLSCYWYFKDVTNQATTQEDNVLLAHVSQISEDSVFKDQERDGIVASHGSLQLRNVQGSDGYPLFHHYSWARTKEGMTLKLRNWTHRDDLAKGIDIARVVEYIFRNDEVNDIIHNYNYLKVPNFFNINM